MNRRVKHPRTSNKITRPQVQRFSRPRWHMESSDDVLCSWQAERSLSIATALLIAVVVALVVCAVLAVVIVLPFVLAYFIMLVSGAQSSSNHLDSLGDLWRFFSFTGACIGLTAFAVLLPRDIVAFRFDAQTQALTYTKERAFLKTRDYTVSFASIDEIGAFLSSSGEDGSLHVRFRDDAGNMQGLRIGIVIPGEQLEEYGQWLAVRFGDRLKPTEKLDD